MRNGNADGFSRNPVPATAADAAEEAAEELVEAHHTSDAAVAALGSQDRAARIAAAMIEDLSKSSTVHSAAEHDGFLLLLMPVTLEPLSMALA